MNWAQFIITYAICWWLVLLMVFTIRVKIPENPGQGHVPSAPENPRIRRRLLIATLVAFVPALLIKFAMSEAYAESGVYHAGSGSSACVDHVPSDISADKTPEGVTPADLEGGAFREGDTIPVVVDVPTEHGAKVMLPHDGYSYVPVGTMEVGKDGKATMNGRPLTTSKTNGQECK